MVKTIVELTDTENQVVNIVKAKERLHNKSDTIEFIINEYSHEILEPELRPDYLEKLAKIKKEKGIHVRSFSDRYGLK